MRKAQPTRGDRSRCLWLSVDLEPIEVILVIPVAFVGRIRKSRRAMRHASDIYQILATNGNARLGWRGEK